MRTITLSIPSPDDEEMVLTILEGLRRGKVIQFPSAEPDLPAAPEDVQERVRVSLESPRLSWEEGLARLGL